MVLIKLVKVFLFFLNQYVKIKLNILCERKILILKENYHYNLNALKTI